MNMDANTNVEADTRKIGGFLVTIGAMKTWQVEDVLLAQSTGDTRIFGEIAIALGYIDDAALQLFVDSRLGEAGRAHA
jgi:hypothetical protein